MTPEVDLMAIWRRWAAATSGPWTAEEDSTHPRGVYRVVEVDAYRRRREARCSARPQYLATVYSLADTEFIAHSREDVGTLLAEIKKLKTDLEARTCPSCKPS